MADGKEYRCASCQLFSCNSGWLKMTACVKWSCGSEIRLLIIYLLIFSTLKLANTFGLTML